MATVIAGYYGFGNAGDELILLSLIRRFRKENPDHRISVLSKTPGQTREMYGVEAYDRWRPWTWVRPLLEAKRFVLGGGGLLQESSGPWNHLYYLSLIVLAKLFGCKTEVVALGVDPAQKSWNRFLTRTIFNSWTDKISVRDEASRQVLRELNVRMPIDLEPDPVMSLQAEFSATPLDRIAFALSPSRSNPRWVQDVAQLCDRIYDQLQIPVDFLVFFPYEDEVVSRQVAAESKAVSQVRIWKKSEDLLSWIPAYRLVVGTRFHALVLSEMSGIPFIGWGGQKKTESFCRTHHRPYTNTDRIWNEDELFRQVGELYQTNRKSVILATRTD